MSPSLTLAPAATAKSGVYSGIVTASGTGQSVRTPYALTVKPATRTLTLVGGANRPGVDKSIINVVVQNTATGAAARTSVSPGTTRKLVLEEGDYRVFGHVWEQKLSGTTEVASAAVHYAYLVTLDSDRELTIDVADAQPVTLDVDRDDAVSSEFAGTGLVSRVGDGAAGTTGIAAPLNAAAHSIYAVGSAGPDMPGFTFFGAGSFQQSWITAWNTATGMPIDVTIRPYYFAVWYGDVTGSVVDVGDGANISGLDLAGKVVIFEPGFTAHPPCAPPATTPSRLPARD